LKRCDEMYKREGSEKWGVTWNEVQWMDVSEVKWRSLVKCVYYHWIIVMYLYVGPMQYVVSLLLDSLCYFQITRLNFLILFLCLFLVLYVWFLFGAFCVLFCFIHCFYCGPGSSVGIGTVYGLDGPGIESRWDEIFRTRPDRPWGPPSLLHNGYRVFPGGNAAGAWCLPPTPFSAEVKKE
jgi:hypothetical protein